MERFYRLVAARHGETFDVAQAARLEVEWWRVHRDVQRREVGDEDGAGRRPGRALRARLRRAGRRRARRPQQRALAMRHSDRWVQEGCDLESPLVREEREALVRSYAALLAAVHRS